jgi:hypothetical protein
MIYSTIPLMVKLTVGSMELARAMELARSLSNDILGKLYKEFRPNCFTGVSLAY